MEVTNVTKEDLGRIKSLQNLLTTSEIKVSPAECAAIGDLMLWFQNLSAKIGRTFQNQNKPTPPPSDTAPLKVVDYHPGEIAPDASPVEKA